MMKKSLTVLALASLVAVGACKKSEESTEGLGADTMAAPAAAPAPVVTDTMAAPVTTDTGAAATTTDTAAADTTQH